MYFYLKCVRVFYQLKLFKQVDGLTVAMTMWDLQGFRAAGVTWITRAPRKYVDTLWCGSELCDRKFSCNKHILMAGAG